MAKMNRADSQEAKRETVGVTRPNDAAPLELEPFGGETVGICDPNTGVCTVPAPVDSTVAREERSKQQVKERPEAE